MPRTTADPKSVVVRARVTVSEAERLRKSAEELNTTMTAVLMRGLGLVEAEIEQQKRQATDENQPA